MIQMGKSMPCLYEQMVAVPAMASAQQSGNSNNSSNNSSNNNSNNNASQSYEEMLGGSSGAGGMSLVPQGGASGQFQPTPDKIEESQTVDKMATEVGELCRQSNAEIFQRSRKGFIEQACRRPVNQ